MRRAWDQSHIALSESKVTPIPEADYAPVRANLLHTLLQSPEQLRLHMSSTLGAVVRTDFPQRWPGLVDEVKGLLGNGDVSDANKVAAGLTALLEIFRAFRWRDDNKMMPPLSESALPVVLDITRNIMASPSSSSAEAGHLVYLAVKIYKTSINSELTPYHQSDQGIVPWGQQLLLIVQKDVDASQMPADEDERQTCTWWKAKKWAYFSLNKLFSRYV